MSCLARDKAYLLWQNQASDKQRSTGGWSVTPSCAAERAKLGGLRLRRNQIPLEKLGAGLCQDAGLSFSL